ncbi:hypothetical protein ACFQ77_34875, partial [Streptomyces virginiae]
LEGAERGIRDRLSDGHRLAWVAETGREICGHVFLCLVERMPDPYEGNNPVGYVTLRADGSASDAGSDVGVGTGRDPHACDREVPR